MEAGRIGERQEKPFLIRKDLNEGGLWRLPVVGDPAIADRPAKEFRQRERFSLTADDPLMEAVTVRERGPKALFQQPVRRTHV